MEWISIKDRLPSKNEFGNFFLCCIKTPTNNEYEVAEWFNPLQDGIISTDKSTDPEFLITYKPYYIEVIAWAYFDEYCEI